MAKRRKPPLPRPFEPRHPEPPPKQQVYLDPYEEDDAITLPWLPLAEREPGMRH
jgi:hypothetical protein